VITQLAIVTIAWICAMGIDFAIPQAKLCGYTKLIAVYDNTRTPEIAASG